MRLSSVRRDFAPDYMIDPDLVDDPEDDEGDPLWEALGWRENDDDD